MSTSTSSFLSDADSTQVTTYTWADVDGPPAGVVQIAHGLAEHGERYDRFARALNAAGFVVHAVDHRGHGRTANVQAGAGLVADSDPAREYEETMNKARAVLRAVEMAESA